ncbi:MAG: ABC transporter permease [Lachnospiraceae bacterium]|nr:ABC transporter permease [Lachnospiraceae bacterium]
MNKKRKMLLKMVTASLLRRRSRMLIALLSIAVGATILSGLVTIYYDVPRQMGAQFRNYGANMILVPSDEETMTQEGAQECMDIIPADDLVGASPYRYINVEMNSRQRIFVAAGTDFEQVQSTSPYFMVDGEYPSSERQVLVGKETAELIGARIGSVLELSYKPEGGKRNSLKFTVSGILDTGGDEESYIFMTLKAMSDLTTEETALDVMELSISSTEEGLENYITQISEMDNGIQARLVKRVTKSEASVLSKLQSLVLLVTVVVLLLTMICVCTTMMAVVSERRKEIGLRKALGASDQSIRTEFLYEGMFLGLLGGILGTVLGFVFAQTVSVNVFESSITFQPLLLPVTVIASMLIAALSCMIPIKNAIAIDPALVLKGE